ncbi:hypothetical protein K456DRAFT_953672 [Colletotrichum gloeosporioides 23]|nr:hypothetical protein K456DRAFT_953672 [Colletotrichum gloeosporioides 23]
MERRKWQVQASSEREYVGCFGVNCPQQSGCKQTGQELSASDPRSRLLRNFLAMQKYTACIRTHLTLIDERVISGIISSNGETNGVQFAAHDLVLFNFTPTIRKCSAVPGVPGVPWTGGRGRASRASNASKSCRCNQPRIPWQLPMSPLHDECAHRLMSPLNHVEHPGKIYDSLLGALAPPLRVPRSSSRPSHLFCPVPTLHSVQVIRCPATCCPGTWDPHMFILADSPIRMRPGYQWRTK